MKGNYNVAARVLLIRAKHSHTEIQMQNENCPHSSHELSSVLRMLRSLLSAHGVNPQMITVFIDGYYEVQESQQSTGSKYSKLTCLTFLLCYLEYKIYFVIVSTLS